MNLIRTETAGRSGKEFIQELTRQKEVRIDGKSCGGLHTER